MTLRELSLTNIRSYSCSRFIFDEGINVISGPNGTGKTNLLEAVFYLSCCRGLRGAKDAELVRFDTEQGQIDARFVSGDREQSLSFVLSRKNRRSILLNNVPLTSPRDLMGVLPAVFFRPEDLELLRGGASVRRTYMDMALCQLRPRYLEALSRYRRLHEGKQKLLRMISKTPSYLEMLPEYNKGLSETGALLASYRAPFVEKIAATAALHHSAISGGKEALSLSYRTQALDAGAAFLHMEERREAEFSRMQCLVGAHRDDIEAALNGRSARDYASQGQTRTAAIAMKLAMRDALCDTLGEPPLLLLDDVLSELDEGRQRYLLDHTGSGQTLITCCEPDKVTLGGTNIRLGDG